MSHERDKETYLGDGLYASFDGCGISLRTSRFDGEHWVYLEPDVYESLLAYVEKLKGDNQE